MGIFGPFLRLAPLIASVGATACTVMQYCIQSMNQVTTDALPFIAVGKALGGQMIV